MDGEGARLRPRDLFPRSRDAIGKSPGGAVLAQGVPLLRRHYKQAEWPYKRKRLFPTWSGELLDNIIDYVTYVLIPAFALYQFGLMGEGLSFLSAAIIVVSSAIYYADTGMKTRENFFKGFPVVWNMVVFSLFVIEPGEWPSFAVVVIAGILTFVPVYFLHPVRVVRLRPVNLGVTLVWCAFGAVALLESFLAQFYTQIGVLAENVSTFTKIGIGATSVYLFCIGGVMQLFPDLGRKSGR